MSLDAKESSFSCGVRRGAGFVALASLGVTVVSVLVGLETVAIGAFLVSWALPYAVMVGHLNVTWSLTTEEKTLWRGELWWSHRSIVAVWAYLFARNLGERARGFGRYQDRNAAG